METTADPAPRRDTRVHREVVSYVRRSARMRPHQRRAWDEHHARFVLSVDRSETSTSVHPLAGALDLDVAFGRSGAPLVVEIGPGTGESLVPMAAARPEADVLAFEVYQPAIAQILAQLVVRGVDNVRLVEADASAGLRQLVAPGSIDELWTFFPDPWPKAKHHKRRLVAPEFVTVAASRLKDGASWRLATDWEDYAVQMRSVLDGHPAFERAFAGPESGPRWEERPMTRFEGRGLAVGRRIFDLCYRRVSDEPR
ncbi:MAG TPA: tRNA (guanosine(46)-N7)-methyltransferase TrmB [Propionibacteriaceae bacterium]